MSTQVLCELSQYQSLAFLDPLGSFLDWRSNEVAAAAATPAFMSGAVLMPQMVDSMTCQVRGTMHCNLAGWLHREQVGMLPGLAEDRQGHQCKL